MTYTKQYDVKQTPLFEEELEDIYRYFTIKLKEPNIAINFYKKVMTKIHSLQYLPERYVSISNFRNKGRNLRKLLIDDYIIIYEVINDTRESFHLTYFSQFTKLFKSIINYIKQILSYSEWNNIFLISNYFYCKYVQNISI